MREVAGRLKNDLSKCDMFWARGAPNSVEGLSFFQPSMFASKRSNLGMFHLGLWPSHLVHHVGMAVVHASPQEGVAALQHGAEGRLGARGKVAQGTDVAGDVLGKAHL